MIEWPGKVFLRRRHLSRKLNEVRLEPREYLWGNLWGKRMGSLLTGAKVGRKSSERQMFFQWLAVLRMPPSVPSPKHNACIGRGGARLR